MKDTDWREYSKSEKGKDSNQSTNLFLSKDRKKHSALTRMNCENFLVEMQPLLKTKCSLLGDESMRKSASNNVLFAIMKGVADTLHVSPAKLFLHTQSRERKLARARAMCFLIAAQEYRFKLREIGDFFQKDHSTVCVAISKLNAQRNIYPEDDQKINQVLKTIKEIFLAGNQVSRLAGMETKRILN